MPKSKRQKKIRLTNTDAKGRDRKEAFMQQVRECVQEYDNIYVFSVNNMRNYHLKDLRQERNQDRFFFGKNKIMQLALGRDADEEQEEGLHLVSQHIVGECGLLFTNDDPEEVEKFFDEYGVDDYARSGFEATERVAFPKGQQEQFVHSLEPALRKLGMPCKVDNGLVALTRDWVLCEQGEELTPEQARLLKYYDIKMARFAIELRCHWANECFVDFENPENSTVAGTKITRSLVESMRVDQEVVDEEMDAEEEEQKQEEESSSSSKKGKGKKKKGKK
eukprot:TRINITY_DN3711_c0_g2_i1.p1 TRINITY_DN3711_c0_g2~~TRINITY_DN3711_c0_g2_i1.p1  ORF type:complete len:278 (+),score=108.98 TRINITY_DN3711_c0_g2_i1:242-1075(+)